jgi:hypothetical protein
MLHDRRRDVVRPRRRGAVAVNDITIAVTNTGHRYIAPGTKARESLYAWHSSTISDVRHGLHYEQLHMYECVCVEGKFVIAKINDCPDDHETFYTPCVAEGALTCIGRDPVAVITHESWLRTHPVVGPKP